MILKVLGDSNPVIRLMRVNQTDSGRTWIFTFCDPVHRFMQSAIVMKDIPDVAFAVEDLYERIWVSWQERIRAGEWEKGLEKMKSWRASGRN